MLDSPYFTQEDKGEVFPIHVTKAYGGAEVQFHSFLTSAVDGGKWSTSRPSGKQSRYPLHRRPSEMA